MHLNGLFLQWSILCFSPRLDIIFQETAVAFGIHFNHIIYSEWTYNLVFHYACPNLNASIFPGRKYLTLVKNSIQTIKEKGHLGTCQCSITCFCLFREVVDVTRNFQRQNYGRAPPHTRFKLY